MSATTRLWATRAGIAVAAGLVVGVGTGLIGLRVLAGDSPPVIVPEVPLEEAEPAPRRTYSGPRADGMRRGSTRDSLSGSGLMASRDSVGTVPDLIGRAEGDARRLLERSGFTLGNILFREADEPVGTVLETFPVPGERVVLPATVNLILADRRRVLDLFPDTMVFDTSSAQPDTVGREIPDVRPDTMMRESVLLPRPNDSLRFPPDTLP